MRIAPAPCCAGPPTESMQTSPATASTNCGELCTAAGDKASLAIAMAGLVIDHMFQDRLREASQLASEAMALVESLDDPTLTVGLSFALDVRQDVRVARWSTCCGGHRGSSTWPTVTRRKATSSSGPRWRSPSRRGLGRYCLGRPGWRDDLRRRPGHGPQCRPPVLRHGRLPTSTSRRYRLAC